jgi:alpha-L-arabinofuranosidase
MKKTVAVFVALLIIINQLFIVKGQYYGLEFDYTLHEQLNIYENEIVQKASADLFGINNEWGAGIMSDQDPSEERLPTDEDTKDFRETMKEFGLKMPLNRMAGFSSQEFKWKYAIGPLSERIPQARGGGGKFKFGPLEWAKTVLDVDPDAKFAITFNFYMDTPQDHADFVEFLTGDPGNDRNGGINWAAKRVEYGMKEPLNVAFWEMGNELDLKAHIREIFNNVDEYVKYVRETVELIREINPDAPLCVMALTNPWTEKRLEDGTVFSSPDNWRKWHIEMFKDEVIRENVDYIAYHSYYIPYRKMDEIGNGYNHEQYINTIVSDIKKLGKDVKVYLSEQSLWARDIIVNGVKMRDPWESRNLLGALFTTEYYVRLLGNPNVAAASYHSLNSDTWRIIDRGEITGKRFITVVGEVIKLLLDNLGENVLKTTSLVNATRLTELDDLTTSVAMTTEKGMNIIVVNRSEKYDRNITFNFSDNKYTLVGKHVLTGESMLSTITEASRDVKVTYEEINDSNVFNNAIVDKMTVTVFNLEKIEEESIGQQVSESKASFDEILKQTLIVKPGSNDIIVGGIKKALLTRDGKKVGAQIDNEVMIAPILFFEEGLNFWFESGETGIRLSLNDGNNVFTFMEGQDAARFNGADIILDRLPSKKDGLYWLGLRETAEMFGYQVLWSDRGYAIICDKNMDIQDELLRLENYVDTIW